MRLKYYRPSDIDALFRIFALQTSPDREGILEFANKYGPLGRPLEIDLKPTAKKRPQAVAAESFTDWSLEVREMRHLIQIWEWCRSINAEELTRHVQWRGNCLIVEPAGDREEALSDLAFYAKRVEDLDSEVCSTWVQGDPVKPALWRLMNVVNDKLRAHGATAGLLWDAQRSEIEMHIVPTTLIGYLWLQFARSVAGTKDYRQCGNCGIWFEVGGGRASRSDKRFCAPTCKASDHRRKQSDARRMHEKGIPLKTIAEQLGTKPATLRGWLKKGK